MAIIGRNRQNSKKSVKKRPNVPMNVMTSIQVGWYIAQLEGRKSRCSEVTIMTNRSNHIPTSTHSATAMVQKRLVRAFLNQKTCGLTTLQNIIVAYAHQ